MLSADGVPMFGGKGASLQDYERQARTDEDWALETLGGFGAAYDFGCTASLAVRWRRSSG